MNRNPAEMTGFASLHPGIDHLPMRLPNFDRYGHAWCIGCHGRNGRAVAGDGLCDTCRGFNHGKPEHRRIAYGHGVAPADQPISRTCVKCGQLTLTHADVLCPPCLAATRTMQGETVKLFEPAPAQLPGQLSL